MPYEVCTLRSLESTEVTDSALAQTLCYDLRRQVAGDVLEHVDFYRICLQDHRILEVVRSTAETKLAPLLTYVLTHELIHVVRFGQRLQRVDLADELRPEEESKVERTTRRILRAVCSRQ